MLNEFEKNSKIGIGIGLAVQIAAKILFKSGRGSIEFLLFIVGIAIFIWGCSLYSKAKGYSSWYGALGILSVLGFVMLFLIPDKHKNVQASA